MSTASSFRVCIVGGPEFSCGADENLVAAAERAGWQLPASCRAGVCGSCEGEVSGGEFVVPGRQGEGPVQRGHVSSVKLCRVKPRSDLSIVPRHIAALDPKAQKPLLGKVQRIDRPCAEVAVVKLRFNAGVRAKFKAGQYLKVLLADGQERCFSMANPPQQNDGVELHVRYLPGGRFAESVFLTLQPGDMVTVRLPVGEFTVRESDRPLVFLAGGTGFAPVQSMVEDLIRRNVQRPITVYFGAKTPEHLYPLAIAHQWAQRRPGLLFVPVVSEPRPEDGWTGRTGYVHAAVLQDYPDLQGQSVYACGAPAMIDAARLAFSSAGLPQDEFFCDAFVRAVDRN